MLFRLAFIGGCSVAYPETLLLMISLPAASPSLSPSGSGSTSPVSNLVDLGAEGVLLPDFVSSSPAGLMFDPQRADALPVFQFVERTFAANAYFAELDYAVLMSFLYPNDVMGSGTGPRSSAPVRFAAAIHHFAAERRPLYKGVKPVDEGERIEYVFEAVHLERVLETPLYGIDEHGMSVIVGQKQEVFAEPTRLNADEFVAAMWLKGVRCGLDTKAIREIIASGKTERITVARRIEPTPGVDATVQELTDCLHRDDSPAILPSGKVDLRHFKNRFPQVAADTPLLQKVSRQFGRLGFETDGKPIEPPPPRDFNITDIAGPGTRVERSASGEIVIAISDGFLNIDTQTQMISVNEKIINRDGVNARTTGDLALAGDQFEEHGEVQEGRVVQGRHMTFQADVFGSIQSLGGRVHLLANLNGGQIRSTGGVIEVAQRVSQSLLEAREGEVILAQAEGTTIIAGKVRIGRATGCDIVADEVEIDEALACAITTRQAKIRLAGDRKGVETVLTLWLPDFTVLDAKRNEANTDISALEQKVDAQQTALALLTSQPELKVYLAAADTMKAGAVKLSDAQEERWRQTTARLAKPLKEVRVLRAELAALRLQLEREREDLLTFKAQRADAGTNIGCAIASVVGDVTVRSTNGAPGIAIYAGLSVQDIKPKLRDPRVSRQQLFRDDCGSFSWVWQDEAAE